MSQDLSFEEKSSKGIHLDLRDKNGLLADTINRSTVLELRFSDIQKIVASLRYGHLLEDITTSVQLTKKDIFVQSLTNPDIKKLFEERERIEV